MKKLLEHPDEGYYKKLKLDNFYSRNYIKYESNGNRKNNPSIKEYLDEIKRYLKHMINNIKKSETWKI